MSVQDESSSTPDRIAFRAVTKIFGPEPTGRPMEMLRAGASKDEILEETGHIVGLDDVTFNVAEGEVFVVMGLSGSGKSTLVRTVNRLVRPTSGEVLVNGENMTELNDRELQDVRARKLGMVFQHFALFPHQTVRENVGYALRLRNGRRSSWQHAADAALEMVGLAGWGDYLPGNLSGGMQQRVGLARALAADPPILLLDEAFSALDPLIRREMQNELLQIQQELHKTVLFITHDLNEALRLGDRVCIMRDGAVVQIAEPEEIISSPKDRYVAEFIQDVDQGRVLGVDFVASEAPVLRFAEADVASALERLCRIDTEAAHVVDADGRAVGLVTREDLERAHRVGSMDLTMAMRRDFPRTTATATIADVYGLCGAGLPVAVLDDAGRITSVVNPLDVLTKLGVIEDVGKTTADARDEEGSIR